MIRTRRIRTAAGRAWTWVKRLVVACLMHSGFLSPSMRLLYLEWLREDMHPQHPCMPTVVREIAEVKDMCRG